MTQKIGDTVGASSTYFNGRSRKNKYNNGQKPLVEISRERRRNEKRSIYNRYR